MLFPVLALIAVIGSATAAKVGDDIEDRDNLDSWSNSMYIPNWYRNTTAHSITEWEIYSKKTGTIYLQVFRKVGLRRYTIVGQIVHKVTKIGKQKVKLDKPINTKAGDVIGFYFPANSMIPFDGSECNDKRGLYVKHPSLATVKVGATFTFQEMQRGWNPCRAYSIRMRTTETGSATATKVGDDIEDRKFLDSWSNAMYIPNWYRDSTAHSIKGWEIYSKKTGTIYLQVFRKVGLRRYTIVGQVVHEVTKIGKQKIKVDKPINTKAGDVIGFYFPANSMIPFDGSECNDKRGLYVKTPNLSTVKVGATFTFQEMQRGWNPCRTYSIRMRTSKVKVETCTREGGVCRTGKCPIGEKKAQEAGKKCPVKGRKCCIKK